MYILIYNKTTMNNANVEYSLLLQLKKSDIDKINRLVTN